MISLFTPQRVTVHFEAEEGIWSERGVLNVRPVGPYGRERLGFVLDVEKPNGDPNGTRVFPLKGRNAEIYFGPVNECDPVIIRDDWEAGANA